MEENIEDGRRRTRRTVMRLAFITGLVIASSVAAQQPAKSPALSQQRIPVRKDARRVDTLRITVVRVDTIRITDTIAVYLSPESPIADILAKVDTLRDTTTCGWVPIPIPIPFSHSEGHVSAPPPIAATATVTPEPATWALVATGLVGIGIIARRTR